MSSTGTGTSPAGRIDVHHHAHTPPFLENLAAAGFSTTRINQEVWRPERAIEVMDGLGIAAAILSLGRPGVHLGDTLAARRVARESNVYSATLVERWPGRFGFFAVLTLPDVDGAVAEAMFALDELGADGVVLLTNAHGTYLGDPRYDTLMAVLDERQAVVFVHPTHCPSPSDVLQPGLPVPELPIYLVDFPHDSTRAALNLVKHGVPGRFRDVRFIIPHAGGFLPYVADRIAQMAPASDPDPDHLAAYYLEAMQGFYFDLALAASPWSLPSLLAFARPDHILYGSDHPAVPLSVIEHFTAELDGTPLLTDALRQAIHCGNAAALFPRLAAGTTP